MKKHRLMVLGVSLLASLGVLSSGFAGWVIAAGSQDASGEGSISADYDVKTTGIKSVTLKKDKDAYDDSISFSGKTKDGSNWFSSDKAEEDLKAKFTFTIETYTENVTLSFTNLAFSEIEGTGYATANTKGVVGALPTFRSGTPDLSSTDGKSTGYINITGADLDSSDKTKASKTITGKTLDVTFDITFAWGTKFGGENPVDYFNGSGKTPEAVSNAQNFIPLLKSANGAKFQLSFTVGTTE